MKLRSYIFKYFIFPKNLFLQFSNKILKDFKIKDILKINFKIKITNNKK